jgi:hypothetical protein
MIWKIAISALCLMCIRAEFRTDVCAAASGPQKAYLAQTAGGVSPRAGQASPETSPPPSQEKTQGGPSREEGPAAPPKGDPLKPFVPGENVKADQAIDFPADI